MRPIVAGGAEAPYHWVSADVIPGLSRFPVGTKPVIEVPVLPLHALITRRAPLPVPDDNGHAWRRRKREDRVQVVGHEQRQFAIPMAEVVKSPNSVE
jgi:hypothetical protein